MEDPFFINKMINLPNKYEKSSKKQETFEDVQKLLRGEGLLYPTLTLPIFSFEELCQTILKEKRVSTIVKRLTTFIEYLKSFKGQKENKQLLGLVQSITSDDIDKLTENSIVFHSNIFQLFCYAYNIRIRLYQMGNTGLTKSIFGMKGKKRFNVLLFENNFQILKKRLKSKIKAFVTKKQVERKTREASIVKEEEPGSNGKSTETSPMPRTLQELPFNSVINSQSTAKKETPKLLDRLRNIDRKPTVSTLESLGRSPTSHTSLGLKQLFPSLSKAPPSLINIDSVFDSTNKKTTTTLPNLESPPQSDSERFTGKLKFYNESKEYGFILFEDNSEIFVHRTDLLLNKINSMHLAYWSKSHEVILEFGIQYYQGKNQTHRKAVDLKILSLTKSL